MARTVVITKQGIPGSAATGYSPGGTDVAVSDGGTGASSAAAARTNLGVPATTDLTSHTGNTSNPHSVTKAQVGLSNVDNTSDVNKPVSTAQAAADSALDARLDVLEEDTGWIMPTLAADITATASGGRKHLGYRRYRGRVELAMALDIASPTGGKLLFTLPAGFRHGTTLTVMGGGIVAMTSVTPVRLDGDGTVRSGASVGSIMFDVTYIPEA